MCIFFFLSEDEGVDCWGHTVPVMMDIKNEAEEPAWYGEDRPLYLSHRPLYLSHRPLYLSHRPLYLSHRPLHLSHRPLYLGPCASDTLYYILVDLISKTVISLIVQVWFFIMYLFFYVNSILPGCLNLHEDICVMPGHLKKTHFRGFKERFSIFR